MPDSPIGAPSNFDSPVSAEEVRALIVVGWDLATKLDKILLRLDQLLGPQPSDPRYKSDLYKPR